MTAPEKVSNGDTAAGGSMNTTAACSSLSDDDNDMAATIQQLQYQDPFEYLSQTTEAGYETILIPGPETVFPSPAQTGCEPILQELCSDLAFPHQWLEGGEVAGLGSSLFGGYLEIDEMLKRISTGSLRIVIGDMSEEGAVIRQLKQIVEAASQVVGSSHGVNNRSVLQLAILAIRKACELAEHGVGVIVATRGRNSYSMPDLHAFGQAHTRQLSWSSSGDDMEPHSSPERVAAMIRVDRQLTLMKGVVDNYAISAQVCDSKEKTAVSQSQHLLRQTHGRIRSAINTMVPDWTME